MKVKVFLPVAFRIIAKAKLSGISDGKEAAVNASLLYLSAFNMKIDVIGRRFHH